MPRGRDVHVVERVLLGDAEVFRILIERHRPAMLTYAFGMTGDMADAESLVTDALLAAFHGLAEIEDRGDFLPHALAVLRPLVRERLQARPLPPPIERAQAELLDGAVSADLLTPEAFPAFHATLAHTPSAEREAWLLLDVLALDIGVASRVTGEAGPTIADRATALRSSFMNLVRGDRG